jgi:acetyl esterase/lipase
MIRFFLSTLSLSTVLSAGFSETLQAQKPAPRANQTQADAKPADKSQKIPPTAANVPYGSHPRQVLDFWQAQSERPTPVVFCIHGGGWVNGDKSLYQNTVALFLKEGISVVAINYRLVTEAQEKGIQPPVQWPIADAARALQFVRSKANEWNLDKTRIAATGGSAGGCSSLWLLYHDDLADPNSNDPVARESTRLLCAAVIGAQTSLDPKQLREWMPNARYGGHAFGIRTATNRDGAFQTFYEQREKLLPWIREYSPIEHVSPDDPPVFLIYPNQKKPPVKGEEQADPTHSALLGMMLMEKLKEAKVEGILVYPGQTHEKYKTANDYLIDKLKQIKK